MNSCGKSQNVPSDLLLLRRYGSPYVNLAESLTSQSLRARVFAFLLSSSLFGIDLCIHWSAESLAESFGDHQAQVAQLVTERKNMECSLSLEFFFVNARIKVRIRIWWRMKYARSDYLGQLPPTSRLLQSEYDIPLFYKPLCLCPSCASAPWCL